MTPIIEAGKVDLIEENETGVAGCLDVEPLPGHTAGMLSFRLHSNGAEGIFAGDVCTRRCRLSRTSTTAPSARFRIARPRREGRFWTEPPSAMH